MNATDCSGFENVCCFLDALGNYDKFSGQATYLLVCNRQIGRLEGASDILYIGQSGRLGGRLSDYRRGKKKSTPQDYRILETVGNLTSEGVTVSLHVCQKPPDGQSVEDYESQLLSRYETEHWELPPCNFQR